MGDEKLGGSGYPGKGVIEAMEGKSISDMCAWRDQKLVELLKVADVKNNPCF